MAQETIKWDSGYRWDDGHHWDEPPAFFLPGANTKGHMSADYIPNDRDGYREWLTNLKTELPKPANDFGLTALQKTAVTDKVDAQIALMNATDGAVAALALARSNERVGEKDADGFLRAQFNAWKTNFPTLTEGKQQALRITSAGGGDAAQPAKVKFKVFVEPGGNRIDWTKGKLDGVNVYARLRGTAGWTKIGMDTSSPFTDNRPLVATNVPEVREYMLRGVVKDVEVGVESDIQSATFAG